MDVPVRVVLDLITAEDPLAHTGEVLRAQHLHEMPLMRFFDIETGGVAGDAFISTMRATPETLNSNGVVHGAAISALVDHTGGYGVQRLIGRRGVTSDLHLRFLAAARAGSMLTAKGTVVRAGKTQIVMEVRVTDDTDRLIAVADMALVTLDSPDPPDASA
jgi:uncharacterized protein (TIGR00369 family)